MSRTVTSVGSAPARCCIVGPLGWWQRPEPGIVRHAQTVAGGGAPSMCAAIGSQRDRREADCRSQPSLLSEDTPGTSRVQRRYRSTIWRSSGCTTTTGHRLVAAQRPQAGGAMIVISTRASGKHRRSGGDLWIKTLFSRGFGRDQRCLPVFRGSRPADAGSLMRSPAHTRASIEAD